jgi:ubiquinone/menaquinone biosynthesis C-methylase UbiE
MMVQLQEYNVSDAFSRQSAVFDDIDEANSLIGWVRQRVRSEVLQWLPREAQMLELNCGTGIDSFFFAGHGAHVLATDNAPGMLAQVAAKAALFQGAGSVTPLQCSFNNLEQLGDRRFDYVFSDFGGLNCTPDLDKVLHDMNTLLKPGGYCTLVIMPRICPWELLVALKGKFSTAFRRLKKNGTQAHLEGVHFTCYYYDPAFVQQHLPGCQLKALKGLSIAVPPPFIEGFREKHPRWFARLEKLENRIWHKAPFNRWCDHYVITLQKPHG